MEKEESKETPLVIARKLASVQEIASLTFLNDDLEIAKILGWQIVVRKGEFQPNQKVIYFEIDTQLPEWFIEHEMTDYKSKTSIIAGALSQGIIKPITCLQENENYKVGDDVSEVLNVKKYDDEGQLLSVQENKEFPIYLVPKTDEPRIQSEPRYIDIFKGKPYVATVKYDGTSSTFMIDPTNVKNLWVASRNKLLVKGAKDPGGHFAIAEKYKIAKKLEQYPNYAIQGEIYGPGLMKNPLNVKDKSLAVFTIFDLKENRCLDYDEMADICKKLDLSCVQTFERGDKFDYTLEELLEKSKGVYEGTENAMEGLVWRLERFWDTPTIRASFKVINDNYLIKNNKK